jgi:enoyl-CoA hydratase/carnithine racemase
MWQAMPGLIAQFQDTPDVRCIVIKGSGNEAFAAGADISEFDALRASELAGKSYEDATQAALSAIMDSTIPVIAAVRGICFGGGFALALACDLRLATEDSRFCIPAARLGIAYGMDTTTNLVRRLGESLATEMLLTARVYTATDALLRGMVHQVFPVATFDAAVAACASGIAANAPLSMRSSRLTIRSVVDPTPSNQSTASRSIGNCMDSADYREGRTAFLEKRRPHFKGT